jgi:hypothetical protein
MIWGALLGWLIFASIGVLRGTWRHQGPGNVFYEQPERAEKVPENQYKRTKYVEGSFMLALGLYLWIVVAKSARCPGESSHSKTDSQE